MKRASPYIIFTLLLSGLLTSGIACHLMLPFEQNVSTQEDSYFCSAWLDREIPGSSKHFLEYWRFYAWPHSICEFSKKTCEATNQCDTSLNEKCMTQPADAYCSEKLNHYITNYMAPGFTWNSSYFTVTPIQYKMPAADCKFSITGGTFLPSEISPPTFGAPLGASLSWLNPPVTEASTSVSLVDKDGSTRTAQPNVRIAYVEFAERTGLPDDSGTYIVGKRHLRFADFFIRLDVPFQLGDLNITEFYIQSIGTIIAEHEGGLDYEINRHDGRFFLYASGEKLGEGGTTSFCFVNTISQPLKISQGPADAYFALTVYASPTDLDATITVNIHLSKPWSISSFDTTQPVVYLADQQASGPKVNLAASILDDLSGELDPTMLLWFEDFEVAGKERFLGVGNPVNDIPFTMGDHKVTLVAYDTSGRYNSATMTLSGVPNVAPVAAHDSYATDEDVVRVVGPLGVLANDTDMNGDKLSAEKVSDPLHGTVSLNANGSFTYSPTYNFCGSDSFTYRAHDGTDYSNTATVTITVNCINDPPNAVNDSYSGNQCTTLSVSAPGVLGNDVDVDNDPLTAIKLSDPSNGSLTFNSNGSFTYTPNSNWTGTDSYTYKANDGTVDSNNASVTITVNELSPVQQIEKCLKTQIPSPYLNDGQETSLLAKLDAAIQKYNAGQKKAACSLLIAFKNEVISLMAEGILPQSEGQKLLDLANDIMADMNC